MESSETHLLIGDLYKDFPYISTCGILFCYYLLFYSILLQFKKTYWKLCKPQISVKDTVKNEKKLYQNLMIYKVLKMLYCISNTISCNCLKIHNRTGRTATTLEIDKNIYFSKWLISLLFVSFPKVLLIVGRRPAKWYFFGTNTKFTNETFFQHSHKEYWILSITY